MNELLPVMRSALDSLRTDIDSAFGRVFPLAKSNDENGAFWKGLLSSDRPPIELEEDKNEIRVSAELPGLKKEDFKVELSGNCLVIHGEKKSQREEKKKGYNYSERSYGSFSRSVRLPAEVNPDKISCTYKEGVLDVHLPKSDKAKAANVEIKVT